MSVEPKTPFSAAQKRILAHGQIAPGTLQAEVDQLLSKATPQAQEWKNIPPCLQEAFVKQTQALELVKRFCLCLDSRFEAQMQSLTVYKYEQR